MHPPRLSVFRAIPVTTVVLLRSIGTCPAQWSEEAQASPALPYTRYRGNEGYGRRDQAPGTARFSESQVFQICNLTVETSGFRAWMVMVG